MNTRKPLPPRTRLQKSIAELEADLKAARTPPGSIADDFIDTTDASNFEERLALLSPAMRELIKGTAADNILAFDAIIEESRQRGWYAEGWMALRDWARRQPWAEEAARFAAACMAKAISPEEDEAAGRAYAEQGRILGILRVDLMRAKTDEERAAILNEIAMLEAEFASANRI